jgi:hypothetical protein
MFGGVFHDFLEGPWEQVRGYLREELEQLQNVLASQWEKAFGTDGLLNEDVIDGDPHGGGVVYISNEGPHGRPKWAKVNVNAGVKNRLRFVNFVRATSGNVLIGRDNGVGDFEQITVGDALDISSAALNVQVDGVSIQVNGSNQLEVLGSGVGNWIPLASGAEPMTFISDGAGNPILIYYTP